ncbi:hypothetical protein C1G86_1214 [Dehalococcoides mccartyi]|uniref:Uncharacterized protein n=1 Tax=Dehalococcoides mccartyi TaxID=61435 RepID=A0A328ERZ3_9CHLR|nr:hypothetical protein C1G86_1214 [Dehalococcoides mccartyi]
MCLNTISFPVCSCWGEIGSIPSCTFIYPPAELIMGNNGNISA